MQAKTARQCMTDIGRSRENADYVTALLDAGHRDEAWKKPMKRTKAAMLLVSCDADMYDGAMFSCQGDFLDDLGLEDTGVITAQAGVQGVAL